MAVYDSHGRLVEYPISPPVVGVAGASDIDLSSVSWQEPQNALAIRYMSSNGTVLYLAALANPGGIVINYDSNNNPVSCNLFLMGPEEIWHSPVPGIGGF